MFSRYLFAAQSLSRQADQIDQIEIFRGIALLALMIFSVGCSPRSITMRETSSSIAGIAAPASSATSSGTSIAVAGNQPTPAPASMVTRCNECSSPQSGVCAANPNARCARVRSVSGVEIAAFGSGDNPIQKAIDKAVELKAPAVFLDSGTYTIKSFKSVNMPGYVKAGIHLPSGISLMGAVGTPSVLEADWSLELDVLVAWAADAIDPSQSLKSGIIQNIELSGQNRVAVGLWGAKAEGALELNYVSVHDMLRSGIILGVSGNHFFDRLASNNNPVAKAYLASGLAKAPIQVRGNRVQRVGGDGIAIIGRNVRIEGNTVSDALSPGESNGITLFSDSSHVQIENNTLYRLNCGIGLDGSFPLYTDRAITNLSEFARMQTEAGKDSELGFVKQVSISKNRITRATHGIILWRSREVRAFDNQVSGVGTGILVNESHSSYFYGNALGGTESGLMLSSDGYSPIGTKYNGIGLYHDLVTHTFPRQGNSFSNAKATAIRSFGRTVSDNTIDANTFGR